MLLHVFVFLLGLGILYMGADWLVQGASSVALRFGIRPLVVGLTIVALGTSMPELLLNMFAMLLGEDGLAIGNVVGSNIANIALILGLSAVLLPLAISRQTLLREYPMMLTVMLLFWLLASDRLLSRLDGVILLSGLGMFMAWLIFDSVTHARSLPSQQKPTPLIPHEDENAGAAERRVSRLIARIGSNRLAPWARVVLLVAGIGALAMGAQLMVTSAIAIAELLQIHPVVIGLTIVAIGTSLPELAASMMCAVKKEADMSVGNILGSNMLNVLFVIGAVALLEPIEVEQETINVHFPVMMGFSFVLFPLARFGYELNRAGGLLLLTGFIAYMIYLLLPYTS